MEYLAVLVFWLEHMLTLGDMELFGGTEMLQARESLSQNLLK
jgi:hypothetical protein